MLVPVWVDSGVLVNDIRLDVAFRLGLKSLAVGGTLERTEERREGTSELRWQIKVGCVHTKKASMLQTSLMFDSLIALSTHLSPHVPPVLSPSSPCRRWWCVATLWRLTWPAAWTSTSAWPRCSSFSSFSGTTWWDWTPPRRAQRYAGGTHLGFQLTHVNVLIITVLFEVPQLSQTGCESRAQARDGLDHNSAPSDRLWPLV